MILTEKLHCSQPPQKTCSVQEAIKQACSEVHIYCDLRIFYLAQDLTQYYR